MVQTVKLVPGSETTKDLFPLFKPGRDASEELFRRAGAGIQQCQHPAAHGPKLDALHYFGLEELVLVAGGGGFGLLPPPVDPTFWLLLPEEATTTGGGTYIFPPNRR